MSLYGFRFTEFNFCFVKFNLMFSERQYSMVCKSINSEVKFVKFKSWPYHLQTASPWARNVSSMHLSSLLGNMKILIICLTLLFSVDAKLISLYNVLKTVQTRKNDLLSFNYKYYYWYDCHNNQSTKHVTIFIYIFIQT